MINSTPFAFQKYVRISLCIYLNEINLTFHFDLDSVT